MINIFSVGLAQLKEQIHSKIFVFVGFAEFYARVSVVC